MLEFIPSQWLRQYAELNTQKRIEAEKNGDKDGKAFYKLMNNAVYRKIMENLRKRIDVKLVATKRTIQNGHPNQPICHTKYLTMV